MNILGIKVNGVGVNILNYADDTIILSECIKDQQTTSQQNFQKYWLDHQYKTRLSINKTRFIVDRIITPYPSTLTINLLFQSNIL